VDGIDKPPACPPRPQENRTRRSGHMMSLPKPDKLIRYRQEDVKKYQPSSLLFFGVWPTAL